MAGANPVFFIGENMKRTWNKIPEGMDCKHPFYSAWHSMKQRCMNPKNCNYRYYGGRNIKICNKWLVFINFYNDMFYLYKEGLSLDRIDVNGNYEPSNCRWATRYQQDRNRTNSRLWNGKTLVELAIENNINPSTVRKRFYVKLWPIEKCLSYPVNVSYSRSGNGR